MSTPNPLIPQGSFQAQANRGASNVRIAVATIVAIHIVFFGGLLLQGCKRDAESALTGGDTNTATNLTLPAMETTALYYTNATNLPEPEPSSNLVETAAQTTKTNAAEPWRTSHLGGSPLITSATPETSIKEYTIVPRDTFTRIAKAQGTTVSALREANPEVDPSKIRPGMKIKIPAKPAAAEAAAPAAGTGAAADVYIVKAGDNLTRIARNHGITVGQLRAANNLKVSRVHPGQKLKIPARPAPAPAQPVAAAPAASTNF